MRLSLVGRCAFRRQGGGRCSRPHRRWCGFSRRGKALRCAGGYNLCARLRCLPHGPFSWAQTEALTALLGAGPTAAFCRPVSGRPFPSGRGAFSRRGVVRLSPSGRDVSTARGVFPGKAGSACGGAVFPGGARHCAALWCDFSRRGGERQGCARPRTISSKAA